MVIYSKSKKFLSKETEEGVKFKTSVGLAHSNRSLKAFLEIAGVLFCWTKELLLHQNTQWRAVKAEFFFNDLTPLSPVGILIPDGFVGTRWSGGGGGSA